MTDDFDRRLHELGYETPEIPFVKRSPKRSLRGSVTVPDRGSDDTAQQLADQIEATRLRHVARKQHGHVWGCQCGWSTADRHAPIDLFKRHVAEHVAHAVLASGLVVPTRGVRELVERAREDGTRSIVPADLEDLLS